MDPRANTRDGEACPTSLVRALEAMTGDPAKLLDASTEIRAVCGAIRGLGAGNSEDVLRRLRSLVRELGEHARVHRQRALIARRSLVAIGDYDDARYTGHQVTCWKTPV